MEEAISKEEQRLNEKEVDRLKKLYPLFTFSLSGKVLTVSFSKTHFYSPWIKSGRLVDAHEVMQYLDREHMVLSISKSLMKLYPDLSIGVYPSKDNIDITCWINRPYEDGTPNGHESVGSLDITNVNLHPMLFKWQMQAVKAKQDGWFFCTGHQKAEEKIRFGYFYFAGNYCCEWGDEHPENRRAAARETYE